LDLDRRNRELVAAKLAEPRAMVPIEAAMLAANAASFASRQIRANGSRIEQVVRVFAS
jgi:hypothetical protein